MEKDKRRHLTLLASFGSICFSRVRCDGNSVAYNFVREFTADVTKKKNHFITLKTYFIILPHYFIISYLSDILSFNFIH